ncbi:DUF5631 domain-containing protein [Mycobacterium montefiorense]
MPAFSSRIDCSPWVIGGLWPAELSQATDETATLAQHLEKDLQRITSNANDELRMVKRAGLTDTARHAAEAKVIDEARARAVRRVESTIRQLDMLKAQMRARRQTAQAARRYSEADIERTQVIPLVPASQHDVREPTIDETQVIAVVAAAEPAIADPTLDQTQVIPAVSAEPNADEPAAASEEPVADVSADQDDAAEASVGRHRLPAAAVAARAEPEAPAIREAAAPEPEPEPEPDPEPEPESEPELVEAPAAPVTESDTQRLHRLLAFVVRQEPQLNWAVGDLVDGTTLLVTDLAHGWIPPGIALPVGVRLLAPGRHGGKAPALLGEATRTATYTPGDPVGRSTDFAETESSMQGRELPAVEDLGWELSRLTHWRDGIPRLVHTLAKAATAGTGVVEEEADLLRVHLDTARYQLLSQYPNAEPALLLNCLLLAATESSVADDTTSANYHLAWFHKLDEPPASQWTAED